MTIRFIFFCGLLVITVQTYSQATIYYNKDNEITMRDLSSHYRIAKVDTVAYKFIGETKDFWLNGKEMVKMNYDLNGIRHGVVEMTDSNGVMRLKGEYENGRRSGVWEIGKRVLTDFQNDSYGSNAFIDSLELILLRKEEFVVSKYIRKKDYLDIYPLVSKSYSENSNPDGVWRVVEERPYFPNGMQALAIFIGSYITYPEEARKNNIKGQVIIGFTITKDGSTSDFRIVQGLGYGCDEEAIRVLKLLPDWVPGYQHGKPVKVKYKLPITFE